MIRLSLCLLIIWASSLSAKQVEIPIIPKPASIQSIPGNYELTASTLLTFSRSTRSIARYLETALESVTGFDFKIKPSSLPNQGIFLSLDKHRVDVIEEGYILKISADGITIGASTETGLFYGVQTLLQLVVGSENIDDARQIPCLTIRDRPRQEWRGLMLDESRYFFGMQTVKQLLDWMAYYKLNKFHWHLTDTPGWRLEIKKYPKLTTVGGIGNQSDPDAPAAFYTQKEVKEIIRYARERFIDVIPEIDMPGHAAAANRAYPEFSGGGSDKYPDFTFNPGKESTYAYLTDILREVAALFPSEYIHIGGDEVHFGNHEWSKLPDVQRLMKEHNWDDLQQVEYYFINRMAESVSHLNKTMIGWDEIVNAAVPPDHSMVMWWRHDKPEELQKALSRGYKTVLCPRIPLYFDFVQHDSHTSGRRWAGEFATLKKVLDFNTTYASYLKDYPDQILGVQSNLWTETIDTEERLFYMTFPRIAALAETGWSIEETDYEEFIQRLIPSFDRYREMGIPFFDPLDPESAPEIKGPEKS